MTYVLIVAFLVGGNIQATTFRHDMTAKQCIMLSKSFDKVVKDGVEYPVVAVKCVGEQNT